MSALFLFAAAGPSIAQDDVGDPDGLTPADVSLTIGVGSSDVVSKTLHLEAAPPKADITLAIDTTGSMAAAISDAKADATSIVNQIKTSIPGARFAVVDFKDYDFPPFGFDFLTEWPYLLRQPLTSNTTLVQGGVDAIGAATGGGDDPESYNRVVFESYSDTALGRDTTAPAPGFLVFLGDQLPHDAALQTDFASCPNTPPTDPGRDAETDTDDLTTKEVLDGAKANHVNVSAVIYNPTPTVTDCWSQLTAYTGGQQVTRTGTASLADQIVTLIEEDAAKIEQVSFRVSEGFESWVSFSPPAPYGPFEAPVSKEFEEIITVPPGTEPGPYQFEVQAVADGAVRATQDVTVVARTRAVSNVALTADERSLPSGLAEVPFGSIPASLIPAFAGNVGSTPGGSIPGGSIPGGSIPGGSIPGGSIPGGSITFGSLGLGAIPGGSIPGGSIPGGSIPGGSIPGGSIGAQQVLQSVLLSQITLTNPATGATWAQVLAGTPLDGQALNTLTLFDVARNVTAWNRFKALQWRDVPLGTTLWGGVPLAAFLLGNATLDQLPPPAPYANWAAALDGSGGDSAGIGTTTNDTTTALGEVTVLGVALAGQLGQTDVGSTPGGSIPGGSIPGGSIPAREILLTSIRIAATRLATVALSDISQLGDIVNCSSGFTCAGKTLADAEAAGAIRPSATFGMLLDRLPASHPARQMTVSELIFGFLAMSFYPFEQLNLQGLQEFAGTGKNASYHVDFDFDCAVAPTIASISVDLPSGEFPVPGSTRFSFGEAAPVAGADATSFEKVGTTWTATWTSIPAGACPTETAPHVRMSFQAFERLPIGEHTATVRVRANDATHAAANQARIETLENHEPNDAPSQATTIAKDTLYPAHIGSPGDQDVYRLPLTGLAPGTKVAAFMKVPAGADFDFILRKPEAQGVRSSPGGSIPGGSIPLEDPGAFVDNRGRPLPPDTLSDVPASTPGGSIPGGSIPGGSIPGGSISANRGSATETAQIVTAGETGDALIDVSGYLGSHSTQPYVLRVQVTPPPPLPACPRVTGLSSGPTGTLPSPSSIPTDTKTVFLINRQRMAGLYGASAVNSLLGSITSPLNVVAARPEVKGVVLPVDGNTTVRSAYAAWDANPCSIDAVNGVVRRINDLVDTYRARAPGIKYVVLLGNDVAIPSWRQYDRVQISPEVDEAGELVAFTNDLARPNALYASAARNHFLVDGAYGVRPGQRITWLGRELPLPQDSVSRFVESTTEISGQLQGYLDSSGRLNPQSQLVTGDDFFTDSADAAHRALLAGFPRIVFDTLYPPDDVGWEKADLISSFFGKTPSAPDIAALYAHYNPWLAQPAGPLPFTALSQLASTADVPAGTALRNRILFSIGCHSGLNIPDSYPGDPLKKKDWAQAYAQARAAVWIANNGYGYDDTESIALSGRLMWLFAQKLNRKSAAEPDRTIGEQWVDAVNTYHLTAGDWDVLDEKVMLQASMYGAPWARFQTPQDPPPTDATTTHPDGTLQVATKTMTPAIDENTTADGRKWWDVGDQTLSVEYRSIQPLATRDVTVPGRQAHDPFITALQVEDVADIEPVRAYPTIERSAYEPNPNFRNIFWPAIPVTVLESSFGATLNLIAGQFRPDEGDTELGTERLVRSITVDVGYTATSSDEVRPLITDVGAVMTDADSARIFVRATDETDTAPLNKVAALYNDGVNNFRYQELAFVAGSGDLYVADVHGLAAPPEVIAEARDDAGNVGYSSNKAENFTAITDNTGPEISITSPLADAVFVVGQDVSADYSCSDAGGVNTCAGPVAVGADVDTSTPGQLTFTVTATDVKGNTTTVTHTYTVVQRGILFSSSRSGNGDIYSVDADGGAPEQVTSGPAIDAEPDWFPGNGRLAFTRVSGSVEIYAMDADGTDLVRLTNNSAIDTSPAVSPDGKKIAFASNRGGGGNWDIYVMDADGGNVKRLTTHSAVDTLPAWRPNGLEIAFSSGRTGDGDIYKMNADGTVQTRLTSGPSAARLDTEPAWFGNTIAFSSNRSASFDIYTMPAGGGSATQLTTRAAQDVTPSWVGDGSMLVFASNEPGGTLNFDIWTMNADGTDQTALVLHPAIDAFPEW